MYSVKKSWKLSETSEYHTPPAKLTPVSTVRYRRNLRNRRGFLLGGGGGNDFWELELEGGGSGGLEELALGLGGDVEVGGVACAGSPGGNGVKGTLSAGMLAIWLPSGGGGVNGILSAGILAIWLGVAAGVRPGDVGATGPGGSGVAAVAVWLWDPGSTMAFESCILGFVFPLGLRVSASALWGLSVN